MMEKPFPKVGVGVLIVRDGKVLMGLRKGAHGQGNFAPPGGHLEMGEVSILGFTNDVFEKETKHYVTIFVTGKATGEAKNLEPSKCEKWKWMDWDQLPENIFLPVKHAKEQGIDPRK